MKLQPHQKEKFVQVLRVLGITSAISLAVYYLPNYFLYEQFTAEHSAILLGLIGIKANVWYDSGRVFLNQFEIQRMCTGVQVIAVFLGIVVSVPKVALKKRALTFGVVWLVFTSPTLAESPWRFGCCTAEFSHGP